MPRPFVFHSAQSLVTHTGFQADDLRSLLRGVQRAPGSAIFYHVHHSLFRRHFTGGEFMNDFARWALAGLSEETLAERLTAVDPLQCLSVRAARDALADILTSYLGESEYGIRVPSGKRFFFSAARTFVFPTGRSAANLRELAENVHRSGADVMFHHFVCAPLRLGRRDNDFSVWVEDELREPELAIEIARLSPYEHDLFSLREQIGTLVASAA